MFIKSSKSAELLDWSVARNGIHESRAKTVHGGAVNGGGYQLLTHSIIRMT